MRIIALEEHFATPGLMAGPGAWLASYPQWVDPLLDIGDGRVAAMDAAGIDTAVLSLTAPGAEQLEGPEAVKLARESNDLLGNAVSEHSGRLAGFAAVPLSVPDAAADELDRAVREYGFLGAVINGHSSGRYLDDPFFRPVLDRVAALGIPVYLHPTLPPPAVVQACYAGLPAPASFALSTVGWGWHVNTATHVLRLILGGVFDRYPDLQIIIGHMGETLPFMLPRFDAVMPPELTRLRRPVSAYLRENVSYTFANFNDQTTFANLRAQVGIDRIMFSADYPFGSMAEGREFLDALPIGPQDREKIAHQSAEKLLRMLPAKASPSSTQGGQAPIHEREVTVVGEKPDPLAMSDWPAAEGPPLRGLTVGEALRDAVREAPDITALVEGVADPAARRRWTYRELLADAERTAAALLERFSPGERAAIWADNLPEWVLLEYGAALAGITIVTVNPALRGAELRHVLVNSGAQGLFMLPGYRGTDMRATLAGIRDGLPQLREVLLLTEWDEFLSSGTHRTVLPGASPDDAAQIQYTSGTTGSPKGAVLRHAGITDNAALYAGRAGLLAGDVTVNPMPLFHTAGCVMSVLGTLSVRGTLILPPAFDPSLQLRLLEQERAQSMIAVPTMLIGILDAEEFRSADLSSLRRVVSGGAVVPAELVRRVERETPALVSIVFAQTESSPVITQTSPRDSAEDRARTLGRPLPHTAVRIVDPQTGETLPVGQTGELLTRGYSVMLGYYDDPDATAAAIDADGWLHTGDLATMDERGYCSIDGRLKDMIIRGGENIYPREIEAVLFSHPDVAIPRDEDKHRLW